SQRQRSSQGRLPERGFSSPTKLSPWNCFTCRTSRQGSKRVGLVPDLAGELVHLPDKPAGVRLPALVSPSLGSLHSYLCGTTRALPWATLLRPVGYSGHATRAFVSFHCPWPPVK